jgi:hypothetical protein
VLFFYLQVGDVTVTVQNKTVIVQKQDSNGSNV